MSYISLEKLQRSYNAWYATVEGKQGYGPVSFHDGIVWNEEGYKYKIIQLGRDILDQFDWSAANVVGSGKIAQLATALLGICPSPGVQQNLVDYRDIMYLADQTYSKKLKEIEHGLYLLYAEGNEKDAFNILSHVLNKKYALISYFFFLKDNNKYQVVRPNNFAERFSMLGADPKCALNCSWENYQKYMGTLMEVKSFLEERYTGITLTDAHSFVWMLWMISN